MSIENHPNFHAVNFVTQIISAYYESLRGKASVKNSPDIKDRVALFCNEIEELVDQHVDPKLELTRGKPGNNS